jgi:hypothetical protein
MIVRSSRPPAVLRPEAERCGSREDHVSTHVTWTKQRRLYEHAYGSISIAKSDHLGMTHLYRPPKASSAEPLQVIKAAIETQHHVCVLTVHSRTALPAQKDCRHARTIREAET